MDNLKTALETSLTNIENKLTALTNLTPELSAQLEQMKKLLSMVPEDASVGKTIVDESGNVLGFIYDESSAEEYYSSSY